MLLSCLLQNGPMQHAFCNMWYGKEESAMSLPPQASFSDILSSLQKRQFGVALKGSKDRRAWRSPCTCQAHIHTPHICQEADLAGFTASSDTGKDDDIRLLALHRAQGTFSKTTLHLTNITAPFHAMSETTIWIKPWVRAAPLQDTVSWVV